MTSPQPDNSGSSTLQRSIEDSRGSLVQQQQRMMAAQQAQMMGLDPQAAMANPAAFSQYLQQRQMYQQQQFNQYMPQVQTSNDNWWENVAEIEVPIPLTLKGGVKFLSSVTFAELPESPVLNAPLAGTTISVLNTSRVKLQNTSAVTVTNFTGGQSGQNVLFLGDGFTTIQNNTNIGVSGGANKLLASGSIYSFTLIGSKWYEQYSPSSSTSPPKHITLLTNNLVHTQTNASTYETPGESHAVADLTGLTQYRMHFRFASPTTNITVALGYSTVYNSYTTINSNTYISGTTQYILSGWLSLPSGAQIANCYLAPQIFLTSGGATTTIGSFGVEFKP